MNFLANEEGHELSYSWGGSCTSVIFNGGGHELLPCQLSTFRGPPGGVNNDRSLIDVC